MTKDDALWLAPELEREADFRELLGKSRPYILEHKRRAERLREIAKALREGTALDLLVKP